MKHTLITAVIAVIMTAFAASATTPMATNSNETLVDVKTTEGDFRIKLYNLTPQHRDNFIKLVNDGTYDGTLFHRVIKEFMVQAGDPGSKTATKGQLLGDGDLNYTVPAEIHSPELFHKRGALAAARTGDQVNPERRSSASQFYVVTGRRFTDAELDRMEHGMQQQALQQIFQQKASAYRDSIMSMQRSGDTAGLKALQEKLIAETEAEGAAHPVAFTAEQREAYRTVGGAPHLDGAYTVFGEVVSGMDTIDKIEKAETDPNDRPKDDIRIISMKVVK